ncbi:MAG: hypothetical protein R2828_16510 [Saprospiraceae bacterium]
MTVLWIAALILFSAMMACTLQKRQRMDLKTTCCKACLEAFNQSPVAVGPEGARCGSFTTAQALNKTCSDYFMTNVVMVGDCQ